MSRRATTLVVAAVIAGAALLVFLRGTSNDNQATMAIETQRTRADRSVIPLEKWGLYACGGGGAPTKGLGVTASLAFGSIGP